MTETPAGIGRFALLVIDCPDAPALGAFYAALLGVGIKDAHPRWVTLEGDPPGTTALAFQGVEDYAPPRWPDQAHPQQMHVDIDVPDFAVAEARALELGATVASEVHGEKMPWRTYLDPAEHPFCLVTV
jgi:Glyoxalase-like domain